jgi:hypothetical protein
MKTVQEIELEQREQEIAEAKRLLSIMDKKTALIFCEEMAKKLPNINDTPPNFRKAAENYAQFYRFGVASALKKQL